MSDDRHTTSERYVQRYEELRTIGKDVSLIRDATIVIGAANIRNAVPHYSEHDRRLNLYSNNADQLRGTLEGVGPIICHEIQGIGSLKLPKIIRIYRMISERVQVQGFYGVLERSGSTYSIMQDLESEPTVASGTLLSISLRLRAAYEIASTMAYLHQVGILLKSLSDTTVSIQMLDEPRPVITDLESARSVLTRNLYRCSPLDF